MRKYKLYPDSRPDKFAEFFMAFLMNKHGCKKEMLSFEILTKLTNLKATVANAGPGGVFYKYFHALYVR